MEEEEEEVEQEGEEEWSGSGATGRHFPREQFEQRASHAVMGRSKSS